MITEQIRYKLTLSEGEAKQSRVKSTMRWWTKGVSMVIAKTASRNTAAKAGKMSEADLGLLLIPPPKMPNKRSETAVVVAILSSTSCYMMLL